MNLLDFPKRDAARAQRFHFKRTDTPGTVQKRSRVVGDRQVRRIDALKPQQPALEITRQRFYRHSGNQCLERRHTKPEQSLVGITLGRPLVDELSKILTVAERV